MPLLISHPYMMLFSAKLNTPTLLFPFPYSFLAPCFSFYLATYSPFLYLAPCLLFAAAFFILTCVFALLLARLLPLHILASSLPHMPSSFLFALLLRCLSLFFDLSNYLGVFNLAENSII
jgi:hypothetical protein